MRRSGQTTRLIDQYIQEIYNAPPGKWIACPDHHEGGGHYAANGHLFGLLLSRMRTEHPRDAACLSIRWERRMPFAQFNPATRR